MTRSTLGGLMMLAMAAASPAQAQAPVPDRTQWTTEQDHQHMLAQLGIRALRPGPSGNEAAPNAANYDEALANPFPVLPDPLTLKDGRRVTTADAWWKQRRPEIVEDFDREVFGRVPADVPRVTWTVVATHRGTAGPHAVTGKQLVGRVDNSRHPSLSVEIQMTLVTPAHAAAPVPVMMMFGNGVLPQSVGGPAAPPRRGGPPPAPAAGADPPATEQLIGAGWGFASISPTSVQADNGAGLTKGIIGLVNRGQPRKPDDWGALRAWAWGASRGLDYLETDPAVDAARVGIEGVSRYGKAALVAMAYDTRFAAVLVGSSGEGGAKLHRRNFGEAVENLTAAAEYHWMAGNFLKYGAADAVFGSRNAGDLPVDAHQLLALAAPRPTFISYGVPEKGDAKWLDQQGSYMAAVAAGPVFRLLGATDLGTSDDYLKEKMPAVNVGLLEGQLAWRQHDGGHTDGPNWKYFIPWATRFVGMPAAQSAACDRTCLAGIMTAYLDAVVAHDPKRAPLAANVRFTEDGRVMTPGQGLWTTASGRRPYRVDFIDAPQGAAAVHAVFEEQGRPVLFAARLKVVDRRITEAETMVVRNAAEGVLFAPDNLQQASSLMLRAPLAAERMSRDEMVALAARYPAGLRAGSFVTADVPFAPNAYRFENGVRMAGPGCTFQPPSCENMRTQRIPTLPEVSQRLVAVDEEMGTVLFRLDFGRGSLPGAKYEGQSLVTFEAFKVFGGQVHAAEAIFEAAPLGASSGWD